LFFHLKNPSLPNIENFPGKSKGKTIFLAIFLKTPAKTVLSAQK